MLDGQPLTNTVEDIYFITNLLSIGEVTNFQSWGGGSCINDFINDYCVSVTENSGSQVSIK